MTEELEFPRTAYTTTIRFGQMDDLKDRMEIELVDMPVDECDEVAEARCNLSLDEVEYLANRLLDAVAFQRLRMI